jgi:heme/copper-type cytochrome/quinol oxidase subunit 2
MDRRILLALGAAVAAVVLFVALRPEDEDETSPPPTTTSTPMTTPTTTESSPDTTTTAPPPPEEERIEVEVEFRDGRVVGGVRRLELERGDRVVLVVRSDVADHVHVHGIDIFRDVAPGAPARLRFRPRTPGVVEIELEDRHLLLAELEVQP